MHLNVCQTCVICSLFHSFHKHEYKFDVQIKKTFRSYALELLMLQNDEFNIYVG